MKKLLSILTIGGGILGSTLPMVTACKSKPKPPKPPIAKWDLNNIKLFNLNLIWTYHHLHLQARRSALLYVISLQILAEYNSESFPNKLKETDFMYGSTPTTEHPWAIEVMDINGTTPLHFNNKGVADLNFPDDYTVLTDNALKVKITTTNQYVKEKTATVNGYLSQFLYTNANLNQGHDLVITDASGFITTPGSATVFDISSHIKRFAHDSRSGEVIGAIENIHGDDDIAISKQVFTAFNKQLKTETKTLNDLNILRALDANSQRISFNHTHPQIYRKVTNQAALHEVTGLEQLSTAPGTKLFAKLSFYTGSIPGYMPAPNTYLYLYLGETT